jgi:hypothetical protein
MCVDVYVAAADRWCTTYGELTDALGGTPIVCGDGSSLRRNMCLCCVDLEATADRFGKVVYRADDTGSPGLKDRKTGKREMRNPASSPKQGESV